MGRNGRREKTRERAPKQDARRTRAKVCQICQDHVEWVDYKSTDLLRRFLSDRAKIKARRVTGTCPRHQREVAVAIKTARELALLPYAARPAGKEPGRGGGRAGRGGRQGRAGAPSGAEAVSASGAEAPEMADASA